MSNKEKHVMGNQAKVRKPEIETSRRTTVEAGTNVMIIRETEDMWEGSAYIIMDNGQKSSYC